MPAICGLQKLTLLDYPGRTACTVFLPGCDLRCPFCHNYELVEGGAAPMMSWADFMRFLDRRHGLLDGVVFTGGEPCLQPALPQMMADVRAEGFLVKLDTNGLHPDGLAAVLSAHLADYVAMDIKNAPAKYARTTGLPEERNDYIMAQVTRSVAL
ncbi:MAG: anaerobic ribonucleoside-triphosphate reductase activating protein, partial [Butyrivibrio sp.]|nr:anaerobic ribonucleoside-triphosphate reductase activating protein [Butyrivibrio sp.]